MGLAVGADTAGIPGLKSLFDCCLLENAIKFGRKRGLVESVLDAGHTTVNILQVAFKVVVDVPALV